MADSFRYRALQFWRALRDSATSEELAQFKEVLPTALFELFSQMLPFEQAHAIRVYQRLCEQGHTDPDLLAAGLLHDVGKARVPLNPLERVLYVLGSKFLPRQADKWGERQPRGMLRGFVVAEKHPEWGAEMAAVAGASERLVRLIAHHQDETSPDLPHEEQELLAALQKVDDVN